MRTWTGLMAVLALVVTGAAKADPISEPYWEITYDISDTTAEYSSAITGTTTQDLGPGFMVLQVGLTVGSEARLTSLELTEQALAFGVAIDVQNELLGDVHGTVTPGGVDWNEQGVMSSQGVVTCVGGALICGLAGLPDGVPLNVDVVGAQTILSAVFSGNDVTMQWQRPVTNTLVNTVVTVQGTAIDRVLVPEPGSMVLLGAAFLGGSSSGTGS